MIKIYLIEKLNKRQLNKCVCVLVRACVRDCVRACVRARGRNVW